jgi:hypothetical protein
MDKNSTPAPWRIKQFIPGIAWFFVVLALMCTPGKELPKMGSWFDYLDMDKLIHVCVFGLMAVLFMWPVGKSALPIREKRQYFFKIALCTCIWGFTTELIQKHFIPGRSFDPMDFVADSIGGIAAYWYCRRRLK